MAKETTMYHPKMTTEATKAGPPTWFVLAFLVLSLALVLLPVLALSDTRTYQVFANTNGNGCDAVFSPTSTGQRGYLVSLVDGEIHKVAFADHYYECSGGRLHELIPKSHLRKDGPTI